MNDQAVDLARAMLCPCRVCPRECRVDRLCDEKGFCRIGALARVASAGAHFGEEPVLVGVGGSGTIFFQGCNLDCVFCQNYDISHQSDGEELTAAELARVILDLQRRSCSNINLVSPSHVAPQAMEAVSQAREIGLALPVVYNSGGYDSVEMLSLLAGYIDVYMPDVKYASAEAAERYSGISDYPEVSQRALAEMYRQVGPLAVDDRGLAVKGVMVRHLVMPLDLAGSQNVIEMVSEVAPGCGINVMGQYRPCFRASEFPELLQLPKAADVRRLREHAAALGLRRTD